LAMRAASHNFTDVGSAPDVEGLAIGIRTHE